MNTLNEILDNAYTTREKGTGLLGRDNCSGFVRMAAAALRIKLEGQRADDQIDYMQRNWLRVKNGVQAAELASQHFFVVAGVKGTDYTPPRSSGHVVVVRPFTSNERKHGKPLAHGKYPYAWGGDVTPGHPRASRGERSISWIFNKQVLDNVRYYTPPVFGPHTPEYR